MSGTVLLDGLGGEFMAVAAPVALAYIGTESPVQMQAIRDLVVTALSIRITAMATANSNTWTFTLDGTPSTPALVVTNANAETGVHTTTVDVPVSQNQLMAFDFAHTSDAGSDTQRGMVFTFRFAS